MGLLMVAARTQTKNWRCHKAMNTIDDDNYQAAYLEGYAASENNYSTVNIRRQLYYTALISALCGFVLGVIVSRV